MSVLEELLFEEISGLAAEIMPEPEFQKANLDPNLYPVIYQSTLPKGTTKEAIYRHLIDKAIHSLYRDVEIQMHYPISIFSWVMTHGFGDLIAQYEIAKIIQKRFPKLDVYAISLIHKSASLPLDCPVKKCVRVEFDTNEEMKLSYFQEEIFDLLRSSALVLQTPTYYSFTQELWQKLQTMPGYQNPIPKEEILGEYGFTQASWAHPNTKARCLGLHFLEKGILTLPESEKESQFFFFAYLITDEGHYLYLHALIKSLIADSRDIELLTPDIGGFLRGFEKWYKQEIFRNYGIKEVCFYFEGTKSVVPVQDQGKVLKIIHLGRVAPDKFQRLARDSAGIFGCRGDQSFSHAISFGRPFFYDGLTHSEPFLNDLLAIAQKYLPNAKNLHRLFEISLGLMEENAPVYEMGEKLGEVFSNIDEMQQFSSFIKDRFSANAFIGDFVARSLCHYYHPQVEKEEQIVVEKLIQKQISFSEAIETIRSLI